MPALWLACAGALCVFVGLMTSSKDDYDYYNALNKGPKTGITFNISTEKELYKFGMAPAFRTEKGHEYAFFADERGSQAGFTYSYTGNFADNGLAPVAMGKKYSYIDIKRDSPEKLSYDYADEFNGNTAIVCKDGKYGIIDEKFNFIIAPEYQKYELVKRKNGIIVDGQKKLFVTTDGEIIENEADFPPEEQTDEPSMCEVLTSWKNIKTEKGVLSADGKKLTDAEVQYFCYKGNGMFAYVTKDDRVGLFNDKGELVTEPIYYATKSDRELPLADFYWFSKDGYAVCIGEKENYLVNKKGEVVININDTVSDIKMFKIRAKCFFDGLFFVNIRP